MLTLVPTGRSIMSTMLRFTKTSIEVISMKTIRTMILMGMAKVSRNIINTMMMGIIGAMTAGTICGESYSLHTLRRSRYNFLLHIYIHSYHPQPAEDVHDSCPYYCSQSLSIRRSLGGRLGWKVSRVYNVSTSHHDGWHER